MSADTGVKLRVDVPVSGLDAMKGRCRLHRATMADLDLTSGDPVKISTDRGTIAAYVYPADHGEQGLQNPNEDTVYVGLGRLVGGESTAEGRRDAIVRPVRPAPAERVVHQVYPPGTPPDDRELFSEHVVGALALAGSKMTVYEERENSVRTLHPTVFETVPDGVVIVTENSDLQVDDSRGPSSDSPPSPTRRP